MRFTYPERIRTLIDLPERDQWHLALGSVAQVTPGDHDGPPRDEPELRERQQTAGHRVRGRLADPRRAVALLEARRVRVSQDRQPARLGAAPTDPRRGPAPD
jgi:hypothetical protein